MTAVSAISKHCAQFQCCGTTVVIQADHSLYFTEPWRTPLVCKSWFAKDLSREYRFNIGLIGPVVLAIPIPEIEQGTSSPWVAENGQHLKENAPQTEYI